MLTGTEKTSLALTCAFLALGGGVKAWQRAQIHWGPLSDAPARISNPTEGETDPASADSRIARWGDSVPAGHGPALPQGQAEPFISHASAAAYSGESTGTEARTPLMDSAPPIDDRLGIVSDGPADGRSHGRPKRGNGRSGVSARKAPPGGKVSLNHATAADLAEIPGIGPKTAVAILEYRRAHGLFLDLDELVHVKGIGEKKLERMAPYLMLSPVGEEEPLRQARLPDGRGAGHGMDKP